MEKEKQLLPTLRFSEFEDSWWKSSLSKVIEYTKGYAFKSNTYEDKGTRIVRVSDLGADSIKTDNEKLYISKQNSQGLDKYLLKKNDIIITTVGSHPKLIESAVGRGIFVNNVNEGFLNQNLLKIEQNSFIHPKFIFSHLNSSRYRYYIKGIKRGNANQANITVKELLEYRISLTSLKEQQKIANFLTLVDNQIQTLEKKKSLLEQYKKGVLQKIFKQELRFKDDDGNLFAEWEFVKLKEVLKRSKLKNTDAKIKYVLTNSATQGIVSQNDYFDKDIANQNNLQGYYIVEINDFIYNPRISQSAPVGPLKRNNLARGVMSPLYTVLRPKKGNLEFLEFYFETTLWHKYMKAIANYGARHDRMNITMTDFENLPIPFPSLKEQTKIANFLSAIDKNIALVNTKIEHTKSYKKGLLQQMFV